MNWQILSDARFFNLSIIAALSIGITAAIVAGWRSHPKHTVFWRWAKFISSILASAALLLLLLNYDLFVRSTIDTLQSEESRMLPWKFQFALSQLETEACAHDENDNNCKEMGRVASAYLYGLGFNSDEEYAAIEQPKLTGTIKRYYALAKSSFDIWLIDRPIYKTPQYFSFSARVWIFRLAAILGLVALVGSVGEAAFQLRQTYLQTKP